MIESLKADVKTYFQSTAKPRNENLVIEDGFDELTKPIAVDFFNGKSWEDLLHYLQNPAVGYAYLEEWAVLSPIALAYYLRAYLEFLIETLSGQQEHDVWYISDFFHWQYQMIYMHKGSPLSPKQTAVIVKIAEHVVIEIKDYQRFAEIGDDILINIDLFLKELNQYGK